MPLWPVMFDLPFIFLFSAGAAWPAPALLI